MSEFIKNFGAARFGAMAGVAATMVYDAAGRVIATLNPDHTFAKTVFDPWRQEVWDANDTVLLDARRDPDVGPLLRGLPSEDYLPTWYQQRSAGALGPDELAAAQKAAANSAGLGDPQVFCQPTVAPYVCR